MKINEKEETNMAECENAGYIGYQKEKINRYWENIGTEQPADYTYHQQEGKQRERGVRNSMK